MEQKQETQETQDDPKLVAYERRLIAAGRRLALLRAGAIHGGVTGVGALLLYLTWPLASGGPRLSALGCAGWSAVTMASILLVRFVAQLVRAAHEGEPDKK